MSSSFCGNIILIHKKTFMTIMAVDPVYCQPINWGKKGWTDRKSAHIFHACFLFLHLDLRRFRTSIFTFRLLNRGQEVQATIWIDLLSWRRDPAEFIITTVMPRIADGPVHSYFIIHNTLVFSSTCDSPYNSAVGFWEQSANLQDAGDKQKHANKEDRKDIYIVHLNLY